MGIPETWRQALPVVLCDGCGLAGAASIGYGAWAIYHPAGWIVGGAMLLAAAWLLSRGSA